MKAEDRIEPLPVVRAADLTEPDAKKRWLVEGLWTRGVGIIGGLPKSCKSWLGLDLALSVASDTPCLGRFRIHDPGRSLIYMAEDTASVVKERLLGLCRYRELDLARVPIHVITAPTVRLDLERDRRRLAETIRRNRPRLLLLDPLIRCHRLDENDVGQVSGLLAFLRQLQRDHDVSIAVVHHARKNGAGHHGQNLRGSGDFHAWVDSGLYLRRARDRLVLVAEHRAAATSPAIDISLVTTDAEMAHLEVAQHDGDVEHSEDPNVDTAILRLLERAGDEPVSREELRATLRVRNARLSEALSRLAAAGMIKKRANGWLRRPVPVPSL
jgi:hypothetical protein